MIFNSNIILKAKKVWKRLSSNLIVKTYQNEPTISVAGDIYYNTRLNQIFVFIENNWVPLG